MAKDAAELLEQALRLSPAERAALADSLLGSLDTEADVDAEDAWAVEIARRIQELDSGAVRSIPWAEARRQLRARWSR